MNTDIEMFLLKSWIKTEIEELLLLVVSLVFTIRDAIGITF